MIWLDSKIFCKVEKKMKCKKKSFHNYLKKSKEILFPNCYFFFCDTMHISDRSNSNLSHSSILEFKLEVESKRIDWISYWLLSNFSNYFSPFKSIKLQVFESNRTNFKWIQFLIIWLQLLVGVELNELNLN